MAAISNSEYFTLMDLLHITGAVETRRIIKELQKRYENLIAKKNEEP